MNTFSSASWRQTPSSVFFSQPKDNWTLSRPLQYWSQSSFKLGVCFNIFKLFLSSSRNRQDRCFVASLFIVKTLRVAFKRSVADHCLSCGGVGVAGRWTLAMCASPATHLSTSSLHVWSDEGRSWIKHEFAQSLRKKLSLMSCSRSFKRVILALVEIENCHWT